MIHRNIIVTIAAGLLSSVAVAQGGPPPGYNWIQNPANGHSYALTQAKSWTDVRAEAATLGSDVIFADILDQSEQDWVNTTFLGSLGVDPNIWIGLSDQSHEGLFRWESGEALAWENWLPGQPDNAGDEDFVHINSPGQWNDNRVSGGSGGFPGLLEYIPSLDADQDGLTDLQESSLGTDSRDQDSDDDGLSDGEEVNSNRVDTRWIQGPNGNYYRLAPASSWSQASSAARAQGYELTSVQDQAEAEWLADTYGAVSGGFWIGLSDFLGNYTWSDGDPSTFRRWATGEPNAANSPAGVFVGGPSAAEPGYWYTNAFGAGSYLAVWEAPGPDAPMTATDPLNWDTDGDGLGDGQEDGLDQVIWDGDLDGDGIPDVGGTDLAFFVPDADPGTTTDPLNLDSDNDGLADGAEDLDGDGARGASETDPSNFDTDGDQLPDGLELGLTAGTLDTDGNVFIADADPLTTTNPTLRDTDSGGVEDGIEDQNRDGGVDTWETDPNDPGDEAFAVYFSGIFPGGKVHIEVWNAAPLETIIPAYSLKGPGPSPTGIGINVDLTRPITLMDPFLSDASGRASVDRLPVPASAPPGLPVWMQAVEVPISGNLQPRASNPVLIPIGAN